MSAPNAIDPRILSEVDPKTKAKISPEWQEATDFLSESDKAKSGVKSIATPVMYNPITGLLETTVKLRGEAGSVYGSNKKDLLLTGITANQLAESYYMASEVQSTIKRIANSGKAVGEAMTAANAKKMQLADELKATDAEIAKINTSSPTGARLATTLQTERTRIVAEQKAAQAAANKAYANSQASHQSFIAKPRVLAPPAPAAAPGKSGSWFSGWGTKKAPRRRVNRSRRH